MGLYLEGSVFELKSMTLKQCRRGCKLRMSPTSVQLRLTRAEMQLRMSPCRIVPAQGHQCNPMSFPFCQVVSSHPLKWAFVLFWYLKQQHFQMSADVRTPNDIGLCSDHQVKVMQARTGDLTTDCHAACLHFGMSLQNENTSFSPRDAINTLKIVSCANERGHKCLSETPQWQEGCRSPRGCPWEVGAHSPSFQCAVTMDARAFLWEQGCCSHLCC